MTFDIAENYDDYNLEELIFGCTNPIERTTYEDIIAKKKEAIFQGKNWFIKDLYANQDKVIKLLSTYFINDNERYYYYGENIFHNSIEALRLLLSLDSKEEFIRLLHRKIDTKALPNNSSFEELKNTSLRKTFTFEDKVPLYTVLEVMGSSNIPSYYEVLRKLHEQCKNKFNCQYYLSDYLRIKYDLYWENSYFILPEGIKRIERVTHTTLSTYSMKIINESLKKTIVLPKTLKSIKGNFFDSIPMTNGIVLNDGIEEIGYHAMLLPTKDTYEIPSSLEDCDKFAIDLNPRIDRYEIGLYPQNISLKFKDYKNSKILSDPKKLYSLLRGGLFCQTLNFKNKRGHQSGTYQIDVDVFVYPEIIRYVILEDKGEDIIKIDLDSINCYGTLRNQHKKKDVYLVDNLLGLRFAKMLIAKIYVEEGKKLEDKPKSLKL